MSITLRAAGTYVNGTGNITPAIPAGTVFGDVMLCFVGTKPYSGTNTLPFGWVSIGSATDGTVAVGADTGSMKIEVFYKIYIYGEANPLVTNSTNDVSGAVIMSFAPSSGFGFDTPVGAGGGDNSAGTGFSVTAGSNPGITVGDMMVAFAAIRSDAGTQSSISLSATGATIAAFTESPGTDLATTSGNDMAMSGGYALCTAGTASAAPVYASTLAASHTGSAFIVRLRESALPALFPKQVVHNSAAAGTVNVVMGTVAANSKVIVSVATGNNGSEVAGDATISDNVGGGLSWTKKVDGQSSAGGNNQIWEAPYTAGGALTVTAVWGSSYVSATVYIVEGFESSPGGATATGLDQSNPSVSLTTGRNYSLVICVTSDWNVVDGTTRTYRNGETEAKYFRQAATMAAFHYFKIVLTAATESFGLTAPTMTGGDANTSVYEVRLPAGGLSFNQAHWN